METKETRTDNGIVRATMRRQGVTMQTDREEFAIALKTYRLRQGLTQKQLGERWGLSRYSILRAEKMKKCTWEVTYRLFAKLAEELRREQGGELI